MTRNNVDQASGRPRSLDPHRLLIERPDDRVEHTADFLSLPAERSRPPTHIPFDDQTIIDTDGLA